MFAKLKAMMTTGASRAMNRDTMMATCHGLARVIYADGTVDDAELESVLKIVKNNQKLQAFGAEFTREFDRVMDAYADSPRMGRIAANRAIAAFAAVSAPEDKENLLVACLDMTEADGDVGDDELKVVTEIANILGLNIKNYLD